MPGSVTSMAASVDATTVMPDWQTVLDDAVTCLTWSDEYLFSSDADGLIRVFNKQGVQVTSWQAHRAGVIKIVLQPHGKQLVSSGEDGCIKLWQQDGKFIKELACEPGWIEHVQWSSDGKVIAAAAERTIYLWKDQESIGVWYDAKRHVLAIAWANDGKRLAMACNKGIHLWRLGQGDPVKLMEFPGAPIALSWKPDNKALAVGTQDGFLQIWRNDTSGKSKQLTMRGYTGKVNCLSWHPQQKRIATAGGKDVVVWDYTSAKQNKAIPLSRHNKAVTTLAYAPTAKWLASGDREGHVCVWDKKLEQPVDIDLHEEITSLVWSSEGRYLAVGNTHGQLNVYDFEQVANA